jgi:hypothetical protein
MRDVHRGITAGTGRCRHRFACKWLTPSDPRVLAAATSDDMGAAIHIRVGLVDVAGIESRENLVTITSARTQAPSMYFLGPESTLNAVHRADILSSIFSPFMFWVVPTASSKVAVPRPETSRTLHRSEK